ncbi:MAG: ribosome hibernation-promoting factor, HPF/YfiA family [Acutalibacteraceae bacterium]|nr:ribosome-associated translation inhibitor RaiA [Oscillospiraceae bacterium]
MKVTVIGKKCTPRDSFIERAEKKLSKIDKFFGDDAVAKVTAKVERNAKVVEVTINHNGVIFRAQERSDDMIDALDNCVDILIRQIRKNKTKLEKKFKSAAPIDFSEFSEPVTEEEEFELVRTKEVPLKPQSIDEAILQMNMLGHMFYMFINAETNEICVVYARKDGGYGLLIPEKS